MADSERTKILVVEDDATLAEMLRLNLTLEGYDADVAHSAEEAVELPLADYSLVLLDVMMGEMSGFDLARRMKADEATRHIPIMFCTARDNEDDMVRGLGIGADDYIYKPYTIRNVMARIEAVLRRSS
ncbi:MAG: response regulator transcription factor, partial [Muribaculaceae bacterium]|nr:response regulator transcription factor [Muribaculaceae bacterium]